MVMKNFETGKYIKLSNGDEYYICRNLLAENAEYFLLLNMSGKLVGNNTEMLLMKYNYPTEEFKIVAEEKEINTTIRKMIELS